MKSEHYVGYEKADYIGFVGYRNIDNLQHKRKVTAPKPIVAVTL